MQTIRQGDVLFIPMDKPQGQGYPEDLRKDGVIQEGEATGHHHRVADLQDADVFRPRYGGATVCVHENGARIIHEEHAPVTLAPNTVYRVHIAREFDYLANAMRYVRD